MNARGYKVVMLRMFALCKPTNNSLLMSFPERTARNREYIELILNFPNVRLVIFSTSKQIQNEDVRPMRGTAVGEVSSRYNQQKTRAREAHGRMLLNKITLSKSGSRATG